MVGFHNRIFNLTNMQKWLLLLTGWFGLSACNAQPHPSIVIEKEREMKSGLIQQAHAFFLKELQHTKENAAYDSIFRLEDLSQIRQEVWEEWKKANKDVEVQNLPSLTELPNAASVKWDLPATLEPHAIMPFYYAKKGDRPDEGYPLYLFLHGSGNKNSEWKYAHAYATAFKDAPSVYFIPQIPNEGAYYRWWQKAKQFAWEKLLRLAFVSGEIDANRVYVAGISEGGYGSQRLASFYGDYWAGAGPMAGGEPLINAPVENCFNLAFSLRTGELDEQFARNRLTKYTQAEFARLHTLYPNNYVNRIELISNRGHGIDYHPTTVWLRNYQRNPYPKWLNWENLEMDGRYRDGYYNLYVVRRSNQDFNTRTAYRMLIEGNIVSLDISEVKYTPKTIEPRWNIPVEYSKSYTTAQTGEILLYLSPELLNLNEEVKLVVNGKALFQEKLKPNLKHLLRSCVAYYDPARLYPVALRISLDDMTAQPD